MRQGDWLSDGVALRVTASHAAKGVAAVARIPFLPKFGKNWYDPGCKHHEPMSTMNISLPDDMKDFVDSQVSQRGFGTSSEFVRDLIRREQERQHLRGLMLEAMASPRVGEADAAYFKGLRQRVTQKAKSAARAPAKRSSKRG